MSRTNKDATNDKPVPAGYRLVPCPGFAHKPGGALRESCMLCAPRWGVVARLTPETIRQIAQGMQSPPRTFDVTIELARIADHVLSVIYGDAQSTAEGDREILRTMLRAYAHDAEVKT